MSAVFFATILLFLVNIRGSGVEEQSSLCNWVCGDPTKVAVGTHGLTSAKFNFIKRVDRHCQDDRAVNSSDFIKVGIILAPNVSNVDNLSEFNFLIFGMEVLSEYVLPLLFGNQYGELESFNNSVSCILQPKSNVSIASNGLDTLYSPLSYFRRSVRNSQKTPYVGYVEIGESYYLSAGFNNSKTPKYYRKFVQWDLTLVINLSILLVVVFTLFIPSVLSLFCPTIKTIQIERLSRATNVEEPEDNPCSEETGSPTEQEESNELSVDPPRVNLDSDHIILSAAGNQAAGKEFLSSRVTTERGELKGTLANFSLPIEDLDQVSSSPRAVRYARGFVTRLSNKKNNSSNEHSEMVGLPRPAVKVNPPATVSENFSQTHSGGTSGHGTSRSISTMEQSSVISTIEPDTPQTGVQHQNIQNRNLDRVTVMDVGGPASPVGLRSFIANFVFSKSQSLSLAYRIIMFVILIIFPQFFAYCTDAFVLGIPRLFPRIAFNLPSPFLTKSGFIFTHEICPGFMYFCFFCYFIRICCFCFLQYSSNWVPIWVPSFVDRKHFICFFKNHYLSQLVHPNNSWSACDECKKAPEVEIPVNIKNNLVYIFSLDIFYKNVKDLYQMYQEGWLLQGNEAACIFRSLRKWLVLFLWVLGLFILFTVLLALDIIASLPVISLCYGRVWFVLDWAKRRLENCCFQAFCLIGEFLVTFFSIVWIVYFSFCCSLSMVLALLPFCIAGISYPVEILLSVASYIIVGHIFWSCYIHFTGKYENLLQKLINSCSEDYASELNRYRKGDVINIPWKLFTSACDKLRPVKSSVQELCVHLIVWVSILFLVFSFSMGINNGIPTSTVLLGTNSFIVVVQSRIWDFLLGSSEEKERKDEELKIKVKDHVDAFFKGKLD